MAVTDFSPDKIVSTVMLGASVMGEALSFHDEKTVRTATMVLTGAYDDEIKAFAFYREHKVYPTSVDSLRDPQAQLMLDLVKDSVRNQFQKVIDLHQREIEEEKAQDLKELKTRLAQTNKPDPLGTVSELAAKYGKSKSEIRRLKAEGRLHELEEAHNENRI